MEALLFKLRIIEAIVIVAVVIFFVFLFKIKDKETKKEEGHRSLKTSKGPSGVVFGKEKNGTTVYSPAADEGHIAVFGGSGSGKTSAILIPTLRCWPGTSLTIDISGDISSNVDCPNKLIYEPGNPFSVPYDIFAAIDGMDDEDDQNEALAKIAYLLLPEIPDASANAKYYQDGGRNILTASLIAFYHSGKDFIEICKIISSNTPEQLFKAISEQGSEIANYYIGNFQGVHPQNVSGCKQTCETAVNFFATTKKLWNSIRRPKPGETAFTPAAAEKHNVFVLIPDVKTDVYGPLMGIIASQTLAYLSARPTVEQQNVLLCLDEFASLGKLDIIGALRKLRKKRVRIMILTQNLTDLEDVYGRGAHRSMLSNFAFTAILGVNETETQEYLAKLIGQEEKERISTTSGAGLLGRPSSVTRTREKDFIIQPSELAHLGDELILLSPDGYSRFKKAYYFR